MGEKLSERIKIARNSLKISQRELAEKVGVSLMTVSRWETGQRIPRSDELPRIATALDTTVEYLMNLESPSLLQPELKQTEKEDKPFFSMAYWGGVADNLAQVLRLGDKQKIGAIYGLLNPGVNQLAAVAVWGEKFLEKGQVKIMPQMILNMTPELQARINSHIVANEETPEDLAIRLLEEYVDDCDDADRIANAIDVGRMKTNSWPDVRVRLGLVN